MIHSPRVAMYVWEAEANFRQGIDIAVKTDAKSFEPRAVMKAWRVSSREKARDSKRGRSWARSTDGSLRASRARPLVGQWIGTLHGPFEKAQDRIHIDRWCRAVSRVVDCVGNYNEFLPIVRYRREYLSSLFCWHDPILPAGYQQHRHADAAGPGNN